MTSSHGDVSRSVWVQVCYSQNNPGLGLFPYRLYSVRFLHQKACKLILGRDIMSVGLLKRWHTQTRIVQQGLLEGERCGQGISRPQGTVQYPKIVTESLLPPSVQRKPEESSGACVLLPVIDASWRWTDQREGESVSYLLVPPASGTLGLSERVRETPETLWAESSVKKGWEGIWERQTKDCPHRHVPFSLKSIASGLSNQLFD